MAARLRLTRWRQHGLAAVELAIALPVFVLLLVAVGELGRVLYEFNTLTKAVRDGARYMAEHALVGSTGVMDLTAADIVAARNLVVFGTPAGGDAPLLRGLAVGDVTVVAVDPQHVLVTATYDFQPLFGTLPEIPPLNTGGATLPDGFAVSCAMRAL